MKFRTLGRTGLQVSELGFGSVEIGMEYGIQVDGASNQPTHEDAIAIVQAVIDRGINVIDTARGYGKSETIIGEAIEDRRDELIVMSKISGLNEVQSSDQLKSFITESLETSLRELRTDCIDVYQIHSATNEMIAEGHVVEILEGFRQQGMVKFLGATVYEEDQALDCINDGRLDVLQIAYSMLAPAMSEAVIPKAAEAGVAIVARSVLHRGVLTTKGAGGSLEEQRLHQAAQEFSCLFDEQTESLPHAAIRYVLSNDGVSCALLGMDSMAQVEENLSFGGFDSFSDEQIQQALALAPNDPWSILPPTPGKK